jgi:hypothetical protein
METPTSLVETLFEKTQQYTRTTAELYKLKAIGKSADVLSALTARLAVTLFATLFFLILNIGIALWIGDLLERACYGFFIVAGYYGLGSLVLHIFRNKWIKKPLRDSIIEQALN